MFKISWWFKKTHLLSQCSQTIQKCKTLLKSCSDCLIISTTKESLRNSAEINHQKPKRINLKLSSLLLNSLPTNNLSNNNLKRHNNKLSSKSVRLISWRIKVMSFIRKDSSKKLWISTIKPFNWNQRRFYITITKWPVTSNLTNMKPLMKSLIKL